MGYGSSLIFYRLGCCGAIGFGLCLFSSIVIAWFEPCFNAGAAMPKRAFGLYALVYMLTCTQHALGPRLNRPDSSEHPHALRFG